MILLLLDLNEYINQIIEFNASIIETITTTFNLIPEPFKTASAGFVTIFSILIVIKILRG